MARKPAKNARGPRVGRRGLPQSRNADVRRRDRSSRPARALSPHRAAGLIQRSLRPGWLLSASVLAGLLLVTLSAPLALMKMQRTLPSAAKRPSLFPRAVKRPSLLSRLR